MSEIILGAIIIAILVVFYLYVRETNKERAQMVNALIAKNAQEMRDMTMAQNIKVTAPAPSTPPDVVPLDSLSEEEFDTHIQQQLQNG